MTTEDEQKRLLRHPLYALYYIADLTSENSFKNLDLEFLASSNTEEPGLRKRIMKAIESALKQNDYDYQSVLPDISHENKMIKNWLLNVYKRMQIEGWWKL